MGLGFGDHITSTNFSSYQQTNIKEYRLQIQHPEMPAIPGIYGNACSSLRKSWQQIKVNSRGVLQNFDLWVSRKLRILEASRKRLSELLVHESKREQ